MTILILIIFFVSLIIYQIYLLNYPIIEGATTQTADDNKQYQDYSENELILSKKNAGNIEVLKDRLDSLTGLDAKIEKTNADFKQLQEQVKGLTDAQIASAMDDIPVVDDTENLLIDDTENEVITEDFR